MLKLVAGTEAFRGTEPKCGSGSAQVRRGQGGFLHPELGNSSKAVSSSLQVIHCFSGHVPISSLSLGFYRIW